MFKWNRDHGKVECAEMKYQQEMAEDPVRKRITRERNKAMVEEWLAKKDHEGKPVNRVRRFHPGTRNEIED